MRGGMRVIGTAPLLGQDYRGTPFSRSPNSPLGSSTFTFPMAQGSSMYRESPPPPTPTKGKRKQKRTTIPTGMYNSGLYIIYFIYCRELKAKTYKRKFFNYVTQNKDKMWRKTCVHDPSFPFLLTHFRPFFFVNAHRLPGV